MGFRDGPTISDEEEKLWGAKDIDDILLELLEEYLKHNPEKVPPDVNGL